MKPQEVKIGKHKAGLFVISVQAPVNQTHINEDNLEYFEVFLTQSGSNFDSYVHIVDDEKFNHFEYLGKFQRPLSPDDIIEYNSYVNTRFQNEQMPTFKLSRQSIVDLFEKCFRASNKIKKQNKMSNVK